MAAVSCVARLPAAVAVRARRGVDRSVAMVQAGAAGREEGQSGAAAERAGVQAQRVYVVCEVCCVRRQSVKGIWIRVRPSPTFQTNRRRYRDREYERRAGRREKVSLNHEAETSSAVQAKSAAVQRVRQAQRQAAGAGKRRAARAGAAAAARRAGRRGYVCSMDAVVVSACGASAVCRARTGVLLKRQCAKWMA